MENSKDLYNPFIHNGSSYSGKLTEEDGCESPELIATQKEHDKYFLEPFFHKESENDR